MKALHLILPPLARFAGLPEFRRWLARGDRLTDAPRGRQAAYRELFKFPGTSLPMAALLREHCAGDAGENAWLCADPAHVQAEAAGARLLACGDDLQLAQPEAGALAQSLRPLVGDAGAPLEICTPTRWCLRLPLGARLPEFVSGDDALGAQLLDCLPQGEPGRRWRALFNEAQVILHAHPVNAARAARGQPPVNAVWFQGAGALPAWVQSPLDRVASHDPVVQALARRADVALVAPSLEAFRSLDPGTRMLFDLCHLDAAHFERDWWPRVGRALREGRTRQVEAAFAGGERFRIKRWHRWRRWRRAA